MLVYISKLSLFWDGRAPHEFSPSYMHKKLPIPSLSTFWPPTNKNYQKCFIFCVTQLFLFSLWQSSIDF